MKNVDGSTAGSFPLLLLLLISDCAHRSHSNNHHAADISATCGASALPPNHSHIHPHCNAFSVYTPECHSYIQCLIRILYHYVPWTQHADAFGLLHRGDSSKTNWEQIQILKVLDSCFHQLTREEVGF